MLDRLHACIERCEATTDEGSATLRQAADRLYFFLRDVMDPLVRGFLLSAPEFCADYKKARKAAAVQDRTTANPAGNLAQDAVLNA
jgi:hypothetical protein